MTPETEEKLYDVISALHFYLAEMDKKYNTYADGKKGDLFRKLCDFSSAYRNDKIYATYETQKGGK